MSLRFQTGICTTGKWTDKCSLSGKRTGRDRGFLMPQAALRGQEVWAASPQATSSVPVGRDHWILSWFQHRALGETELCLMCKHDLIQSPAHRQGDAAGFPVPVLPPIHSWFSTTLAQEVFRSCPHSVHSLALDITSFFVLHQRERLSMGNCGNCGWAVPSVVQLWAHVWTLCWSQMDPLEETKGLTYSLWLFWWGPGQDLQLWWTPATWPRARADGHAGFICLGNMSLFPSHPLARDLDLAQHFTVFPK